MERTKKYIEIARLTKPQGLKGLIRAQLLCDNADVFDGFKRFYLGESKSPLTARIREIRKGFVVLELEDIDNIVTAENLVGEFLYVDRADYTLPDDSWFICDLIGLDVADADTGKHYGKVEEILQNAPKDVYVIRTPEGKQLLFPSVPEVLISVDIAGGLIKIRPLEGLFDEN
ncbi:MAG: ribosome maturation factor RimM [Oscillospiraceae bacterium]|nr:ribosome maturation factor RimM [Oscillospiraceae bacterium]